MCRSRQRGDIGEGVEFSFRSNILFFHQAADLLYSFFESDAALVQACFEASEFVGKKGPAKPHFGSATVDGVQHANLSSEFQGVVESGQHGPGDEPGFFRLHGGCEKEYYRVGAVSPIRMKVMLHGADRGVAKFVAQSNQV